MKKASTVAAVIAPLLGPTAAWAQAHQHYSGLEARSIKALSEQQVADLKAGRGMGLALAAELNGYPGPVHVLELAAPLGLTNAQRDHITQLFEAMRAEAVPLGERLIAAEAALDSKFASRSITEASLRENVQEIGLAQAALRAAHLRYHLATVDVLTPEQVAQYAALRGYTGGKAGPHRQP
jgi:Spy/CpxP family protein refolding chaperone